jgi:hypothetical protein
MIDASCRHVSEQKRRGSIFNPDGEKRLLQSGLLQMISSRNEKAESTACTLSRIDVESMMASLAKAVDYPSACSSALWPLALAAGLSSDSSMLFKMS